MDAPPKLLALERWRHARRGRERLLPLVALPTFVAGAWAEMALKGLRWRERGRFVVNGTVEARESLDDGRSVIERLELEVWAIADGRDVIQGTRNREYRTWRLLRFVRDRAVIFRVGGIEVDPSLCEPLLRPTSTGFASVDGDEEGMLLWDAAVVEPELGQMAVQSVRVRRAVLRRGEGVTVFGERGTRVDPSVAPGGYRELPLRVTVAGREGRPAFVVADWRG